MNASAPELSASQWHFLTVLHCLKQPVSIDLVGAIAPPVTRGIMGPDADLPGLGPVERIQKHIICP